MCSVISLQSPMYIMAQHQKQHVKASDRSTAPQETDNGQTGPQESAQDYTGPQSGDDGSSVNSDQTAPQSSQDKPKARPVERKTKFEQMSTYLRTLLK